MHQSCGGCQCYKFLSVSLVLICIIFLRDFIVLEVLRNGTQARDQLDVVHGRGGELGLEGYLHRDRRYRHGEWRLGALDHPLVIVVLRVRGASAIMSTINISPSNFHKIIIKKNLLICIKFRTKDFFFLIGTLLDLL